MILKDENYLCIQGWMRTQLGLKGNELMAYALIYGFCQDDGAFTGSVGYIADWLGATKRSVFNMLKALIDKGLLEKQESHINGIKYCQYRTLIPTEETPEGGGEKISPGVKNFHGGGEKISPGVVKNFHSYIIDNKDTNNKDNNIDKEIHRENQELVNSYNNICVSLPKVTKLTDKRKRHIKARLKTHTADEIKLAFIKTEQSDFLSGRKGDWHADFDWIVKSEDNLVKILENHYDNRDNELDRLKRSAAEVYQEGGSL